MTILGKLLRGEDVAEILNVSRAFAYRLMAQGDIPTVRLGRSVRVRPDDLDHFLEQSVHHKDDGFGAVEKSAHRDNGGLGK